jgi:hypothetical protein
MKLLRVDSPVDFKIFEMEMGKRPYRVESS